MEGFDCTSRLFYGKEILFRTYAGVLTADTEIKMLQYTVDIGIINDRVIGMVIDVSKARFSMEPGDGLKIIDFCASVPVLAPLKYAILVDTPDKIIFPLLGGIKREGHKLKPFATEEAAVKWILT